MKLGHGDSVKSSSGCSQHVLLWFILSFFHFLVSMQIFLLAAFG